MSSFNIYRFAFEMGNRRKQGDAYVSTLRNGFNLYINQFKGINCS